MSTEQHGDRRVLVLDPDGPLVADAGGVVGDAWSEQADVVAIPVARLDPEFFDLRTGVAGELAQKLVNYRLALAVVGDVSPFEERSRAFRDWVRESNRGDHVWFVPDDAALHSRLIG